MTTHLYGRIERSDELKLERANTYPDYEAAVLTGQQRYGYGNFMVDTGGRCPSRTEQLLGRQNTHKRKVSDRKHRLLEEL